MNTSCNKIKISMGCALALMLAQAAPGSGAPLKEGTPFPDLTQCHLEGALPDLQGKIVLIDFFASWCDPCKESFPVMEDISRKYGSRGLVVIAVNLDKSRADMEEFLKRHPISFVVVRDAGKELVNKVKIPTMPSSFLLDREGKVHAFHRGFRGEATRAEYEKQIETLLK